MRFYLDEDIASQSLINMLSSAGHDVITTHQAGNSGATDEEQLTYAADKRCVLISGNIKDFIFLNNEWQKINKKHYGIMLIQRRRNDRANADRILAFARKHKDEKYLPNVICYP